MTFLLAAAAAAFFAALVLDIALVSRRRPWLGFFLGLLPILAYAARIVAPPFFCQGDCEWAGMDLILTGPAAVGMLALYVLFAAGLARAYRAPDGEAAARVPVSRPVRLSLRTLALLLACGAAGGLAALPFFSLANRGVFVRWQSLGTPPDHAPLPGETAVRIHACDSSTILVETSAGRILETGLNICGPEERAGQECWFGVYKEVSAPLPVDDCPFSFRIPEPPGPVRDRAAWVACSSRFGYRVQADYALLEDGSVWVWRHEADPDEVFNALPALAPGILAGMALGVVWMGRRGKK